MAMYALQFVEPSHDVSEHIRREIADCIGELATFYVTSLSTHSDLIWVTTDKQVAELVAVTNTEWYNADAHTPSNDYVGCLKVVELIAK